MSTTDNPSPSETPFVRSEAPSSLELTAYQGGQAVIREKRVVTLAEGRNRVFLAGLPTTFDPNSLTVVSVQGEGKFKLGPTSYKPASLSTANILQAAVGQVITLIEQTPQGPQRTTGTLRHVLGNQLVLEQQGGTVLLLQLTPKFELAGGLPAGLSALSSLLMEPTVAQAGDFGINILYEAEGITWSPRYEAFYDAAGEKLTRFACYVDLTNNTGARLDAARFKLIAGANYGGHARKAMHRGMRPMAASMTLERAGGGEEADFEAVAAAVESVGEQKMYVLPDELSLDNGETKQTALIFAENVPVRPEYYLSGGGYYQHGVRDEDLQKLPVNIRLRAKNDKASNLGVALPPAEVKVLEPDSSGALQKTDTTSVSGHVAADEDFKLDLRNPCKDLKATRKLVDFKEDPEPSEEQDDDVDETPEIPQQPPIRPLGGPELGSPEAVSRMKREVAEASAKGKKKERKEKPRYREEAREVTVHNFKDKEVEVLVSESFPLNCEFLTKSQDFAEQGQNNGLFKVTVPAKGKATVSYRIKYRIN